MAFYAVISQLYLPYATVVLQKVSPETNLQVCLLLKDGAVFDMTCPSEKSFTLLESDFTQRLRHREETSVMSTLTDRSNYALQCYDNTFSITDIAVLQLSSSSLLRE